MLHEGANPFQALIDLALPVAEPKVKREYKPGALSARAICARKLLQHGALEWNEFMAITGWKQEAAAEALGSLRRAGIAHRSMGAWRLCE
jgi:hypothetical protein